ncbi:Efflux pump membrane transporter BepE [compost metagenome]
MPLAISTGAGSASRHSIGTGVIGGMLAATLIATFFIPMFYMLVEKASDWLDSKKAPKAKAGPEEAHES